MKYLNNLKQNLHLYGDKIKPASINQVNDLEKKLSIKLPLVLSEFFLLVGNNYDIIWDGGGGDTIESIDYTLNLSKELLNEASLDLEEIFPFSSYNDDQFLFIYLNEGDNPPVYKFEVELWYCGDDYIPESSSWGLPKGISKVADSFSQMIGDIVKCKLK